MSALRAMNGFSASFVQFNFLSRFVQLPNPSFALGLLLMQSNSNCNSIGIVKYSNSNCQLYPAIPKNDSMSVIVLGLDAFQIAFVCSGIMEL